MFAIHPETLGKMNSFLDELLNHQILYVVKTATFCRECFFFPPEGARYIDFGRNFHCAQRADSICGLGLGD